MHVGDTVDLTAQVLPPHDPGRQGRMDQRKHRLPHGYLDGRLNCTVESQAEKVSGGSSLRRAASASKTLTVCVK